MTDTAREAAIERVKAYVEAWKGEADADRGRGWVVSRFDPYRDTPKAGDYSKNREVLAAAIMTDCAQILDVVKKEWGASWSGWDQGVRDRVTAWLQEHYQRFPRQTTGAEPGRQSSVGEPQPKGTK